MFNIRVIPCLLLNGRELVKTVRFKDPKYVGDPINVIKVFNEKEVDEIVILDITATIEKRGPDKTFLSKLSSECFMPLSYGGGLRSLEDMKTIFQLGFEKVIINTCAAENPCIVEEASKLYGSQSVVVAVDIKTNASGEYEIFTHGGRKKTSLNLIDHIRKMEWLGAGEILLSSIDRDGTMKGYDIELIKKVTGLLSIPVIASGGAGRIEDFVDAVKRGGASAVSAGSMFVFHGKHRAVLITYPSMQELKKELSESGEVTR